MNEKMYLVCRVCGEAFDDIATASGHPESNPDNLTDCPADEGWDIQPESVAL
jgi:hypothetical protein